MFEERKAFDCVATWYIDVREGFHCFSVVDDMFVVVYVRYTSAVGYGHNNGSCISLEVFSELLWRMHYKDVSYYFEPLEK